MPSPFLSKYLSCCYDPSNTLSPTNTPPQHRPTSLPPTPSSLSPKKSPQHRPTSLHPTPSSLSPEKSPQHRPTSLPPTPSPLSPEKSPLQFMASKMERGWRSPNKDPGVGLLSIGEFICIRTDVNASEFGPMGFARPTLASISGPSDSIYGSSSPSTKFEGASKEFGPHVCLVLATELNQDYTWRIQVCVTRTYGSGAELESYLAKYPDRHIPLPYDGGDLNNCSSPKQFGRPLGVGSYLGVKEAYLVAVKRWVVMGNNAPVCTCTLFYRNVLTSV